MFGGKGKTPKVRTGPNKGKERTRTASGSWRRTRSDKGEKRS
jgi:hypothetical protein